VSLFPRLIEPVLAAPHDLAPRRAYADAVRAEEPDRAKLIDLQLAVREAARAGRSDHDADRAARALIRAHGARWCGPIASAVDTYAFWGGFVEDIRVTGARLTESSVAVRGFAPIRMLTVTKLRGFVPALAADPLLGQLVALDIGENGLTDDDLAPLIPKLASLAVLRIAGNVEVGFPTLRALAALPKLRFVDADDTNTPLRIRTDDAVDGRQEVAYTAAQGRMEDELGKLPWLMALERPSNAAL
jgi:hypothetical protein